MFFPCFLSSLLRFEAHDRIHGSVRQELQSNHDFAISCNEKYCLCFWKFKKHKKNADWNALYFGRLVVKHEIPSKISVFIKVVWLESDGRTKKALCRLGHFSSVYIYDSELKILFSSKVNEIKDEVMICCQAFEYLKLL